MGRKRLDYGYEFEFDDIDDILDCLGTNVKKDIKGFEDLVTLDGALRREIYLCDIVDGTGMTVESLIRFWNQYDNEHNISIENRKPIKIYIDSNGGNLLDTFTMIDAIKMSKTPVWTICTGAAYSGGFFTFIAGHRRVAYPHTSFLYHEGATSTGADAGKFRNFADFYQKQLGQLKEHTLEYTKFTPEFYDEHYRDDLWLTADEALELGVCDEIAEDFI